MQLIIVLAIFALIYLVMYQINRRRFKALNIKLVQPSDIISEAKKNDSRFYLICFTSPSKCPFCVKLHKQVFAKPEVQAFLNESEITFGQVKPSDPEARKFIRAQEIKGIRGVPTCVLFDLNDKEVTRVVGYMTADKFVNSIRSAI